MGIYLSCLCLLLKKTLFSASCLRWALATFFTAQEIKCLIEKLFSRIKKTPDLLAYVQYIIKFNEVEKFPVFPVQHRNTFFTEILSQTSQNQLPSTGIVAPTFYLDISSLVFGIPLDFQTVLYFK